MNLLSVLQQAMPEVSDSLKNSTELVAQEQQISLLDMALKGGCLMIPLALMLLIAIYIFIERLVVLKKASKEDSSFMNRVKDYIYDGKIDSALSL
ncbi:MAG: MotA/TolQ/ExbB proton channel family protein, partial [Paludibacteraceae bacterium]|nr:MotA/TolQ/ExbB proton channel family protein [Paludibacteraceae bacterium]